MSERIAESGPIMAGVEGSPAQDDGPFENSSQPLLEAEQPIMGSVENTGFEGEEGPTGQEQQSGNGMPTVECRVCSQQIPYDSNSMQHVVRCGNCNEATPIRAAPTGKKFVRCPCNCLLICKVSSNRIACPRQSCGRVIILQPPLSQGASVPAPAGTARVQCYYCEEVFMFNTLTSCVAPCPHCQKKSSVGPSYVRSRSFLYFFGTLLALLTTICVIIYTSSKLADSKAIVLLWIGLAAFTVFLVYRFYYFVTLKISKVLGPI